MKLTNYPEVSIKVSLKAYFILYCETSLFVNPANIFSFINWWDNSCYYFFIYSLFGRIKTSQLPVISPTSTFMARRRAAVRENLGSIKCRITAELRWWVVLVPKDWLSTPNNETKGIIPWAQSVPKWGTYTCGWSEAQAVIGPKKMKGRIGFKTHISWFLVLIQPKCWAASYLY